MYMTSTVATVPTVPAVEARTPARRSLGEDAQGEGGIREVPKVQPAGRRAA